MKRICILLLLSILLNAQQIDNNKTISNEEFLKELKQLEQEVNNEKIQLKKLKQKTKILEEVEKKVNEIAKQK